MVLFDKFRKKNSGLTIEEIIANDYEQEYFDECKYIWKNYVPSKGQADSLQGELLREMEKIRCEAQDNGNINWDDDYSYFCDFISERLCEHVGFSLNLLTLFALVLVIGTVVDDSIVVVEAVQAKFDEGRLTAI